MSQPRGMCWGMVEVGTALLPRRLIPGAVQPGSVAFPVQGVAVHILELKSYCFGFEMELGQVERHPSEHCIFSLNGQTVVPWASLKQRVV